MIYERHFCDFLFEFDSIVDNVNTIDVKEAVMYID